MDLMGNLVSVEGVDERERESLFQNGMAIVRRNGRRRFPLQRESDPLFRAVLADDLNALQLLVQAGNSVNIQNSKGTSLLNFVMRRKSVDIFNYLLSLDEIDVNFPDELSGKTPLLCLQGDGYDYFALQLLKKGACVHSRDHNGVTFLHLASFQQYNINIRTGQMIIEKGANINAQGPDGATPLHMACQFGNFDWICMLLYYGADATLPSDNGFLPIAIISRRIPEEEQRELQEILFNYTFGGGKSVMRLTTVVAAMTWNSSLFTKLLDRTSEILYDREDLLFFERTLKVVDVNHLKIFVKKFGHICREFCEAFEPLSSLARSCERKDVIDKIKVFVNSDYISDFVQTSEPRVSIIKHILEYYICRIGPEDLTRTTLEELVEMIYIMLTYGLNVTEYDLRPAFAVFGYNALFRLLLHMDTSVDYVTPRCTTPTTLFQKPWVSVEDFISNYEHNEYNPEIIIEYCNHPRLKAIALKTNDQQQILKAMSLPRVPLLLELSRNAARKCIVNKYNIKKTKDFYTVLQSLPIGEINKQIISLERKLY